ILRGAWSDFGPYEVATKIFLKVFDGELAVTLFFVLSGTVLFKSLMREDGGLGSAGRFYVRRFFRIYPALLVCLVVCGLAFAAGGRAVT
ncbi:acyltransferase family protein, partial [Klebsiella pneumoniae]|uniref:acyltransferase family protein n=1 Tax=Klebsiella pneumoniae TaxID=573 RepID=UPI0013CFFB7A